MRKIAIGIITILMLLSLSYAGYLLYQQSLFHEFTKIFIPLQLERNINYPDDKVFDPKTASAETLIKLPEPYLRAGSFHPELYPHDASYSISAILRLVSAGILDKKYLSLVKSMLDDFYFMVQRYGYVLNGNRSYYTSRSQANVLASNVLEYYQVTQDRIWLDKVGVKLAEASLNYWIQESAKVKIPSIRLYKWIAGGDGPCVEVLASNKEHNYYYDKVLEKLKDYAYQKDNDRPSYAKGFDYSKVLTQCSLDDIATQESCVLSANYYINDRASRVSGYDTNHLYGPFNAFTNEFIPVDHNAKLYRGANDLANIFEIIGNHEQAESYWNLAKEIKSSMFKLLWDDDIGMFFEYHITRRQLRTNYVFASAGYTIWAQVFDIQQEQELKMLMRLVEFLQSKLEGPSGLYASNIETGMHWDKPYTWPIQQAMIVEGLTYYAKELNNEGKVKESERLKKFADRISKKYIKANFRDWQDGHGKSIKEKHLDNNKENLMTGYAIGENYSWNLLAVLDLLKFSKTTID